MNVEFLMKKFSVLLKVLLLFYLQRLAPYGITVGELTGDHQMNREQIEGTQV